MIGTVLTEWKEGSRRVRRIGLLAALVVPLLALVAVSAGSILRGAQAQRLVLAETYRQVADLVATHVSHRLVEAELYLVEEMTAGDPDLDVLATRVGEREEQQPGLRPMALVGPSGELLRPLTVNDRELEALLVRLQGAGTMTPRIEPVVLAGNRGAAASSSRAAASTAASGRPAAGGSMTRRDDGRRAAGSGPGVRPGGDRDARSGSRLWAFDRRLETITCQLESRRFRLASSGAMSALRYLVDNRFELGEASFDDGFARTRALLEAMPLDDRTREELRELEAEASRLEAVEEALRSLVVSLQQVPELRLSFEQPDIDFVDLTDRSGAALAIAELPGTSARLVHRLDLGDLDDLIDDALEESGPLSDAGVTLVDAAGRPVAGEGPPVPADAAFVSLAVVPGWRVAAFPRSGSLAALARQGMLRNGALLLGAVAALCIGGALGYRGLRREMALSRMRSDFVSSVSHELKTPLALLSASAENLRAGWVPEERKDEYYDTMIGEATRLSHLVDNVLDFRRMEAGARSFHLRMTDLRDLIDEALALYRMPATAAGVELTVDLPADPVVTRVDREALHRVVVNLLSNAMKYSTGEARRVDVRLRRRGRDGRVEIEVADRGVGMSADDAERVCEPFYRGSNTAGTAGSGIGLSIVRHVVAAHDGELRIDTAPGAGTTVTVILPPPAEPGSPPPWAAEPPSGGGAPGSG